MATTKAIRDQLYNILNGMSAVAGTIKTVPQYQARNSLIDEGYVFRVRPLSNTLARNMGRETRTETMRWLIEVFAPPYDVGYYDIQEDALMDYRDLVLDTLQRNTTLTNGATRISGVSGAAIVDDAFRWGDNTFPPNEPQLRYKWQCTLQLTNEVICE